MKAKESSFGHTCKQAGDVLSLESHRSREMDVDGERGRGTDPLKFRMKVIIFGGLYALKSSMSLSKFPT